VTFSANPNSGAKVGALTTVTDGDVKETSPFLKFVKRSEPGEKPRLVILGTGWAAARVARDLDVSKYDLTVISPRNHMVFTPLLASTTVGTLDFRSVTVSLRNIQPALGEGTNMYYKAKALEIKDGAVLCDSKGTKFEVPFDELAICTGAQGSTFGIPGVIEHALPLRDVSDAEKIRSKIIKNVLECQIPGVPEDKKRRMLNFVIVGGGPTGVEFAGELSNLVKEDLMKAMPKVSCTVRITLIEARDILGSFNPDLRLYAEKILSKSGVEIVKAQVKAVNETSVVLSDGSEIDYGLLVWSTGVGPTPFITSLPFAKARDGRLEVDEYLRVKDEEGKVVENIYSLGDCSCISTNPLPTTAQVAEQQGKWLSFYLNGRRNIENDMEDGATTTGPFEYKQLGQMSAMTTGSAVMDLGGGPKSNTPQVSLSGFFSWIGWRAVYLTKLGAFENRIYVLLNWVTTQILGRDLSRW
jgi:NADH:ubiquinone reductase (non-electrogenic)